MCFSGVKLNLKDRESYSYIEEEPMGKKNQAGLRLFHLKLVLE